MTGARSRWQAPAICLPRLFGPSILRALGPFLWWRRRAGILQTTYSGRLDVVSMNCHRGLVIVKLYDDGA